MKDLFLAGIALILVFTILFSTVLIFDSIIEKNTCLELQQANTSDEYRYDFWSGCKIKVDGRYIGYEKL